MIKSNMGNVQISGPGNVLMAEFEHIIKVLYEALEREIGDDAAREAIAHAGRNAFDEHDEEETEEYEKFVNSEKGAKAKELLKEIADLINEGR